MTQSSKLTSPIDQDSIAEDQTTGLSRSDESPWSLLRVSKIEQQFVRVRPVLLISIAFGLAGVGTAYAVSRVTGIAPEDMTCDPTTVIAGAHFYVGALSNVGLLVWGSATGICFTGAAFLSGNPLHSRSSQFLFWSGVLTLLLMLDDALLLHERLFPWGLNIPEKAVFAAYGVFFLGYMIRFFVDILRSEYLLLFLSFLFLGLSLGLDQVVPAFDLRIFIEDSFKFLGIILWLAFFACTTHGAMRDAATTDNWSTRTSET